MEYYYCPTEQDDYDGDGDDGGDLFGSVFEHDFWEKFWNNKEKNKSNSQYAIFSLQYFMLKRKAIEL